MKKTVTVFTENGFERVHISGFGISKRFGGSARAAIKTLWFPKPSNIEVDDFVRLILTSNGENENFHSLVESGRMGDSIKSIVDYLVIEKESENV